MQVKKANRDNDRPWKYRLFTDRYEEGKVDLFAGYVFDEDTVFYVPFEEVGSEFRVNTKSKNNMNEANAEPVKQIDEYTLERDEQHVRVPKLLIHQARPVMAN